MCYRVSDVMQIIKFQPSNHYVFMKMHHWLPKKQAMCSKYVKTLMVDVMQKAILFQALGSGL